MIVVNARFLTQNITGVQRYGIELSLRLKKYLGNEVLFLAPHNILQKEYAEELGAVVVGSHTGYLWEQYDLPLFLRKKGKPLLLNFANMAPVFYRNKISTVHDVAFLAYPQSYSKKTLFIYKFLIPIVLKTSRHIITVSNFSKEEIVRSYHINSNKLSVIYCAVKNGLEDIPKVSFSSKKYFLTVSSLNYRKNFIAVLKAFSIYVKTHPEESLYIIGDIRTQSFKKVDISAFEHQSNIKFLGRLSDRELNSYYCNAIGFIFPSFYEGFGLPPLEAQTCKCPVLLSDIPVFKEVYEDSVIYCNPNDINDIASKMDLLKQKLNQLIELGQENAKRYSFDISAQQLIALIKNYI